MTVRLSFILSAFLFSATANVFRWLDAPTQGAAGVQGDRPCCGPKGKLDGPVTADQLLAELVLGRDAQAEAMLLPTIQCLNCIPMGSTEQYWCVLRPPGTDCSPSWPWNNNFERKRWLYWYDCPGDDIGICCSAWQDDGCCNSSDEEPPCSGGGATHRCSEVACP